MARFVQGGKSRGSQHWLQALVNRNRGAFKRALEALPLGEVEWRSPLEADAFAEYRDQAFLDLLGITLTQRDLLSFWPVRGPQWDGLGQLGSGGVVLVEAKANVAELASPRSQARPAAARLIKESLDEAKRAFGAPPSADWMGTYYQYANRLAHLYLLRACNQVDAYLVFLYFVGASEVQGPSRREDWQTPIQAAHNALELGEGHLTPFVANAFIDVGDLAAA